MFGNESVRQFLSTLSRRAADSLTRELLHRFQRFTHRFARGPPKWFQAYGHQGQIACLLGVLDLSTHFSDRGRDLQVFLAPEGKIPLRFSVGAT